jgi:AcrR family transcriptional regulator
MRRRRGIDATLQAEIERSLHALTMEHLAKLAEYVPGPVKKHATKEKLLAAYRRDPVFSIFGLDSEEYLGATLAGGTVTSIHRKIGDIYEASVKAILMMALGQSPANVTYTTIIRSGSENETRSADAYLQFDRLDKSSRMRVSEYCLADFAKLTTSPHIELVGVGLEVRHCYQTGDSKRTQADEAMARHLLLSGILPIMPLFCGQSNPGIVSRYKSVWVVKQGLEAYDAVKFLSGFDLFDFLKRNRDEFRTPVIELLRSLTK